MAPRLGAEILYLSRQDVQACGLNAGDVTRALVAMFRDRADGRAWTQPKMTIFRPDGASFRAKGGALGGQGYGAMKWFGYFPDNARRGLPDFTPLILLNEGVSGMPVAVMDAVWISAVRTGCISAVAARWMARPDATSIAFVACGTQARTNLDALLTVRPLSRVVAYSRRRSTAESFAEEVRRRGLGARVTTDPGEAIGTCDIVVSSVPHGSPEARFLDAGSLAPGTFVSMVDLGYGWRKESLTALDRIFTDDLAEVAPGGSERLNYDGPYAGDIAGLAAGRIPGRLAPDERNALIFSGTGLADTAVAALVYEAALAKSIGRVLPL
ncbi:MAG: ornithine cyclodeaminase family protein [Acetobacteraceae bacterium]|nr:ornithine cyclodeaminase family protein [Acetobacteraceae bacterium]